MYSWAGQLYTALRTGCQGIKGTSAGLTVFSGIKNAYIFLPTNYWENIFLPTNCTNGHEDNALRKMATGSVALIVTNARRGWMIEAGPMAYCLPGRINAIASSRGLRTRLPSLRSVLPSRQIVLNEIFCPRIALMDTNGCNGLNGDRVGRTNWH